MKYDGANFIGGTSTDSTGKTNYTGTVNLNDKGDAAEETMTTLEKTVSKTENLKYTYEYDENGNRISRTATDDKGKVTKKVKRSITYFKD
ncbi:MAG: hypothetical protein WKF88_11900 [Ferruginibacter sp.]